MSIKIGSFEKNGKKYSTIELSEEKQGQFRFSFGLAKAKLILKHMDEIEKFVSTNSLP